ncbi:MFS transporter [Burkholderia sp. LMG 21824]|uniref:MFS transporter n=1 Tax=Burkholderia sp. LMG 21824 TaxID=3158172 RepID=UPI003C2C39D9
MAIFLYTGKSSLPILICFVFLLGSLRVMSDIAQSTLIPAMMNGKDKLVLANSRVATCQSIAALAAPTAAGWLFAVCGAMSAFLIQAIVFAVATLAFLAFEFPLHEARSASERSEPRVFAKVGEGIAFIANEPRIRWLVLVAFCWNATAESFMISVKIYMSNSAVVSSSIIGLSLSVGGAAFLAGSLCARSVAKRVSSYDSIRLTMCAPLIAALVMLVSLASGVLSIWAILVSLMLVNFAAPVHGVCSVSLRQLITPRDMLVRVQSASRTVVSSAIPIGSVTGALITGKLSPLMIFGILSLISIASLCVTMGFRGKGISESMYKEFTS